MSIVPSERIASRIYLIRRQKVMVDSDLAELYGVSTSALNQQVKRNANRFPDDFAFQLSAEEHQALISQSVTSNAGRGGRRKLPLVFTEQGVATLSSVLSSDRAAEIDIAIVRTFVKLRELLGTNRTPARKVEERDRKITILFDTVQKLLTMPEAPKKIGSASIPEREQYRSDGTHQNFRHSERSEEPLYFAVACSSTVGTPAAILL